jgi:hypothetical protein
VVQNACLLRELAEELKIEPDVIDTIEKGEIIVACYKKMLMKESAIITVFSSVQVIGAYRRCSRFLR